jgi:hypothetical protein
MTHATTIEGVPANSRTRMCVSRSANLLVDSLLIRFMYEALNRSIACRIESIQISDSAFDSIQAHFIVRMLQVIAEATNGAPRNIRLVQFGERAELDCRFRYFEKAHSDGVVCYPLFGEHLIEAAAARQILANLRDVATDILIAGGGLRAGQPRSLGDCSDCYRLERQLPGGVRTRRKTVPLHGAQ